MLSTLNKYKRKEKVNNMKTLVQQAIPREYNDWFVDFLESLGFDTYGRNDERPFDKEEEGAYLVDGYMIIRPFDKEYPEDKSANYVNKHNGFKIWWSKYALRDGVANTKFQTLEEFKELVTYRDKSLSI